MDYNGLLHIREYCEDLWIWNLTNMVWKNTFKFEKCSTHTTSPFCTTGRGGSQHYGKYKLVQHGMHSKVVIIDKYGVKQIFEWPNFKTINGLN